MKLCSRVLVAGLLAAAVYVTAASAGPRLATTCTAKGSIVGYLKTVTRQPCGAAALIVGASLHRQITITTSSNGQLEYKAANAFDRCITKHSSKDKYFPGNGVALEHVSGNTWCRVKPGNAGTYLAVGAQIVVTGTIFGLHSDKRGSTVKVAQGVVLVSSTTRKGKAVRVPAGFEVVVPVGALPGKPQPLTLDFDDQEAVDALKVGTRALDAGGLVGLFRVERHRVGGIVATDQQRLDALEGRLSAFRTVGMTREDFFADPNATRKMKDAGVDVVIVCSSAESTAAPVIERVHADLPGVPIIFVPASTAT